MTAFDRAAERFEELMALPPDERAARMEPLERGGEPPEVLELLRDMLEGESSTSHALEAPLVPRDPAAAGRAHPESIGPYRILGLLGEGGMGRVYEAEQASPRRRVALKVMRGAFLGEALRRRFETEAQALAALNHPGIATVFETGVAEVFGEACPYLAMERVEGQPLDAWLANHSPTLSERVELVARIADAVHHAHQKGIVHRDLKPANVLVDASGRPKVLDFGIARIADAAGGAGGADQQHTRTGQVLGTLPYMSPEQFAGDSSRVDLRSDVHALGVLLYEALSGRRPFDTTGLSVAEAARLVSERDPAPLGSLDARCRGDLETIAAKALEPERERRYPTAAELAADLRRFLEHQPIHARPMTTLYQLRKFVRRNRWLVAGAASTFVALVLGLVGTLSFAVRASDRAAEAEAAGQAARREAETALGVRDLFLRVLDHARPSRAQGQPITVLEALNAAASEMQQTGFSDPEVEQAIRVTLARVYGDLGELPAAERETKLAIALADEHLGPDSQAARNARQWLAMLLRSSGRLPEAEVLWRQLVEPSLLGDGSPARTLDKVDYSALGLLGGIEFERGHFARAAEMSEVAVAGLREHGDPIALCWELFRLSNTRMFLGQPEGELAAAREAYDLALEIGLERLDNPLDFPLQLANALDDSGRAAEAVDLYRETLRQALQWYGPQDKKTLMVQFNLGLAETKLGHTGEAIERLTAAFEGLSQVHRSILDSDDMLALKGLLGAYRAAGRTEEGLLWCDEHVTWFSDDFKGWLAQLARAQLLAEVGVFEEALELARPAHEKIARQLPAGHLHRLEALRTLVTSCEGLDRLDEAETYRAQLLAEERTRAGE